MKEILKFLKGTFDKKLHPKPRGIYAILGGTYSAEFFVFIKETNSHLVFFSLPDKIIRNVPRESFYNGVKNNLVEFIEQLPNKVYKTIELQLKGINTNTTNGLRTTNKDSQPDKRGTCST